MYSYAIIEKL